MEELPDDLVLTIFSALPAEALLGAVPLVCKRWLQLARHPDAWRNVDLVLEPKYYEISRVSAGVLEHALRVARLAPHLRRLHFDESMPLTRAQLEKLMSTVLEGVPSVRSLRTLSSSTRNMRAASVRMLQKFAPSLREVQLCLRPAEHGPVASKAVVSDLRKMVDLIAALPRLQILVLDIERPSGLEESYGGQLGKGCPSLRKLIVDGTANDKTCKTAVLDVLRNKFEVLEEVDLGYPELSLNSSITPGCDKDLEVALSTCKALSKCVIPFGYLPTLKQMTQLQSVGFHLMQANRTPGLDVAIIQNLIKSCEALENISELTLISTRQDASTAMGYIPLLKALSQKCKNVRTLKIYSLYICIDIQRILSRWHHLHDLSFFYSMSINADFVENLKTLPNLRSIRVIDAIFTHHEAEEVKSALNSIRERRPGLTTVLTYESGTDDSDEDSDFDMDDEYENFTYFDYLRNKYGEDLEDHELYAFMSSDED